MTMSCPEVVYQAYYPYLYQRATAGSAASSRTPAFPAFSQYDRFNVQRSLDHHHHHAAAAAHHHSTATSSSLDLHHFSSHHSSAGSVASSIGAGPGGSPGSPPPPSQRHKEEEVARSSAEGGTPGGGPSVSVAEDDDDDDDDGGTPGAGGSGGGGSGGGSGGRCAQYVSANCVVFTHYSGDVAAVVDEHFSRALSYADSKAGLTSPHLKESSPMSARNFPPSFWNSNYVAAAGSAAGPSGSAHHDLYSADPYHHHQHHQSDPWHSHYQQYTHHRAVHEYHHHHHHHNMAAQYGSLLLPTAPRLPPQYAAAAGKGDSWASAGHGARLHHEQSAAHHLDAASYPGYPAASMAGLEAQVQESSKDLYWF